jgi:hypothetical protein
VIWEESGVWLTPRYQEVGAQGLRPFRSMANATLRYQEEEEVVGILIVKLLEKGILNCKLLCIGKDMITVSLSMNS